jgi:hypothetical protein
LGSEHAKEKLEFVHSLQVPPVRVSFVAAGAAAFAAAAPLPIVPSSSSSSSNAAVKLVEEEPHQSKEIDCKKEQHGNARDGGKMYLVLLSILFILLAVLIKLYLL